MAHVRFTLSAGVVAGVAAAAVTIGAAGLGWLVGSPTLAGALAMIVSALLVIGFGGVQIRWWAKIIVGLSWAFADSMLARLGVTGVSASITMAVVYFILGMTRGQTREQVLYAGAGPVLGAIVGIGLISAIFPRLVAQGVEEAVLSAAMISAARAARQALTMHRTK